MSGRFCLLMLVVGSISGTGCVGLGDKVSQSKYQQIREGVTSLHEVERLLGEPKNSVQSVGRTLFVYQHGQLRPYAAGLGTVGLRMTVCSILFETNGLVLKKLLSQGQQNYYGTAFGLAAKTSAAIDLAGAEDIIFRGEATYEQVKQIYGEPLYSILTIEGGTARVWQKAATVGFTKARVRELTAWFDDSDIVTDFAFEERIERH